METVPMTKTGFEQLQAELKRLKSVDRPEVIQAIADARALGDLKENAEYHAAKERQGFIEGRIVELESKLGLAQVIDVSNLPQDGRVLFGTTVDILNLANEQEVRYQIVGEDEADIKQQKISVSSPIARALIGKSEEDVVEVNTPGGIVEYEIIKVHYE